MKRDQTEMRLQIAVADYLRGQIWQGKNAYLVPTPFPDLLWTHPANEGRSAQEGAKFKRMGVRAGTPDLLLWWEDKEGHPLSGAIELKAKGGSLSYSQKKFHEHCMRIGVRYAIARSVAEVRDTLIAWGLECHNRGVHEPAASWEERNRLSMEFNQP